MSSAEGGDKEDDTATCAATLFDAIVVAFVDSSFNDEIPLPTGRLTLSSRSGGGGNLSTRASNSTGRQYPTAPDGSTPDALGLPALFVPGGGRGLCSGGEIIDRIDHHCHSMQLLFGLP